MILAAATEGGGSQYFYLAPKMPYGLEYKPGTVKPDLTLSWHDIENYKRFFP